ncbi:MAG: PKD domain-containing protein [Bacteroidota bacterium]
MKNFKHVFLIALLYFNWLTMSNAQTQIVDWGGDFVTSSQLIRDQNPSTTGNIDIDNDGNLDDFKVEYLFSVTAPLSPAASYSEVAVYGGFLGTSLDDTNGNFSDKKFLNKNNGDALSLRYQESSLADFHGVIYFDKADFLNSGNTNAVSFDATSSIAFNTTRFERLGDVRWLVREGSTFYVSQVTTGDDGSLTFTSNTDDGNWAVYDPATDIDFDATSFSPQNFSDITAIGLVIDKDNYGTGRHWFELKSFTVQAVLGSASNIPPVASFTVTPTSGDVPLVVTFDGSSSSDSDGTIASYAWDFGDGNTASGQTATHTYTNAGTYTATFTVTDNDNATASVFTTITVTTPGGGNSGTAQIVDWGGDFVTSSQLIRDQNPSMGSIDADNDGNVDDFKIEYPFSTTLPLSPTNYTEVPMYGGFVGISLDDSNNSGSFSDRKFVNSGNGQDGLTLRYQESSPANLHGVVYFDKADFLNGGATTAVSFDATSSFSFTTSRFERLGNVRWLVREGTTFYVSEVTTSDDGSLSFASNTDDGNWAVYDPATDMDFDGTTFSSQNFSDVTAVGLVIDKDVYEAVRHWFELRSFNVQAVLTSNNTTNDPPTAAFTATPNSGSAPITVAFDASASSDSDGTISKYVWDFGDGTFGSGVTTTHEYADGGSYTVTLTILDDGRASGEASQVLTFNTAPTADIAANPTTGDASLTVNFDGSGSADSDGTITGYAWDFGDGTTSTDISPTKTYTNPGRYKVTLTVTDDSGSTDVAQEFIFAKTLVVQYSGDYVTSNIRLRDGNPVVTSGIDGDNDGSLDDVTVSYPFSTTTPLSPTTGYTGPLFYGGFIGMEVDATNTNFSDQNIKNSSSGQDVFSLRFQQPGTLHGVIYFDKTEFLNGGATSPVSFDALSEAILTTSRFENLGDTRWVVKEAGVFYVSELTDAKFIDFDGDSDDGNWAVYDPATDLNFDQDNATFTARNFTDIEGFGYLVDKDAITSSRHWLEFSIFEVRAKVGTNQDNLSPEIAFTATPENGRVPQEVNFDASASSDPDGSIADYAWNFGDGTTGNGETIAHTYTSTGTYTATLTITDNEGATATDTKTITVDVANTDPTAVIFATQTSQDVPATFDFDALDSDDVVGNIVAYDWDFGDGTTASGLVVSHNYTVAGLYTVELTVTDSDGATATDQVAIRATIGGQIPPVAVIDADALFGPPPLTVNFDASNSSDPEGTIVSYAWDFGDGNTSTSIQATNAYTTEANFPVSLVVTNNFGLTDTANVTINVSNFPNDNPINAYYGTGEYPWTDEINWGNVVNILDFGGDNTGTNDNLAAFTAATSAPSLATGGVVYFPAGTYNFSDHLYLPDGIMIRGDNPLPGEDNALQTTFNLPTKFEFPAYIFTESGNGTDNSTAFKFIRLEPSIADVADNVGVVYVDVNRAGINLKANDKPNATGRNMVIFGVRTNNVGQPTPGVPSASKGQNAYQRHCFRFTFNILAYNSANILIANTRHNDNVTDTYSYDSYIVDDGGTPVDLTNGKAKFNFVEHYVMEVGQGSGGCSAGTPTTCPENFRPGIDIRDNWMHHEMRVGIIARGQGLKIRNNVITDNTNKVAWVHPTGNRLVGNATTLENRGIDWAGWDVTVADNDIQVFRHKLKDGPYLSIDGEAILIQECCGGTLVNGVDITGNTANSYIGIYKMRDIQDAYIANNVVSTGDTDIDIIYVNANTNAATYKVDNTIVENNTLSGGKANILFWGSGAPGSGNIIRNNTSTGGMIRYSCFTNPTFSNNSGFSVDPCSGSSAQPAPTTFGATETDAIRVYPNPTLDEVSIELNYEDKASILVTDILGRQVYFEEDAKHQEYINLKRFGSGTYLLKIWYDGQQEVRKVTVQ